MERKIMITRRDFIKLTITLTGTLLIGFDFRTFGEKVLATDELTIFKPNAFVEIYPAGVVTVVIPVPEIGQGVRTALAMLVAEELEMEWMNVKVCQADAGKQYGPWQLAGGSFSIRSYWIPLRKAGAVAREILIYTAAKKWGVRKRECKAEKGQIIHEKSKKRINYGELINDAVSMEIPQEVMLKQPSEFKIIGQPILNIDSPEIVKGRSVFGLDKKVPKMLYAVIERCPVYAGNVREFDDSETRKIDGVKDVIKIESVGPPEYLYRESGVAVVANSTWAAMEGRKKLKIIWDEGANRKENTARFIKEAERRIETSGFVLRDDGNFETAYSNAKIKLDAVYHLPHLAHATMEPMNCIADVKKDHCEIWAPTQVPFIAKQVFADVLGMPSKAVILHVTRIGGGFGRRLRLDYINEAVYLSQKIGAPVQVIWTREDDMRHDYYRPFSVFRMMAGLNEKGEIVAWLMRRAGDARKKFKDGKDAQQTEIYTDDFPAGFIPNYRLEYAPISVGIRCGDWRGPGHNANGFVTQCFLDEIAHKLKKDPLDYRLNLLGDDRDMPYHHHGGPKYNTGRMKAVLELVAEKVSWGKSNSHHLSQGIAFHFTFGAYVAMVAEVSVESSGRWKLHRVVAAVDCGILVNRSGAEAQIESGIIDGLSTLLYREITIRNGQVQQDNFHNYPMIKMNAIPHIEIYFIPSDESPVGLGEMALPVLLPAVCNAIFAATGKPIRKLPIKKNILN